MYLKKNKLLSWLELRNRGRSLVVIVIICVDIRSTVLSCIMLKEKKYSMIVFIYSWKCVKVIFILLRNINIWKIRELRNSLRNDYVIEVVIVKFRDVLFRVRWVLGGGWGFRKVIWIYLRGLFGFLDGL